MFPQPHAHQSQSCRDGTSMEPDSYLESEAPARAGAEKPAMANPRVLWDTALVNTAAGRDSRPGESSSLPWRNTDLLSPFYR